MKIQNAAPFLLDFILIRKTKEDNRGGSSEVKFSASSTAQKEKRTARARKFSGEIIVSWLIIAPPL